MLGLALLAAGAVALIWGAELFAEHVVHAARRVGLTVVAFGVLLAGAEPEEALTAAIASGRGRPELAVGDAIGANIVMLTLTLGLAAAITMLPVTRRVREYALAAVVAGVFSVAVLFDGAVSRLEGGLLVVAYSLAVLWIWRREQAPPVIGELAEASEQSAGHVPPNGHARRRVLTSLLPVAFVLAGIGLMVLGGFLAVTGAERVVVAAGLDDTGVGLTLLALATSSEMLALVVSAAHRRIGEVAVAGLVGSVAYNATVSLGVGALVAPLHGVGNPRLFGAAVLAMLLPLVVVLLGYGERTWLSRVIGAILIAGYLAGVPLVLA